MLMIDRLIRPRAIGLLFSCILIALIIPRALPVHAQSASAGPGEWVNDLSPIAATDWNADRAAHLIERAGFGATQDEIKRLAAMTPSQAVGELVDYESLKNDLKPFDESGIWDRGMRSGWKSQLSRDSVYLRLSGWASRWLHRPP